MKFSRISWIKELENFDDSAVYGELITSILRVVWLYGLQLFKTKAYKLRLVAHETVQMLTYNVLDGWVRVLRPFDSISVISRRWKGEHESSVQWSAV